ncbi:MAG: Lrp/AsnC family transcriptional regulator [Candidatus Alkanophagales archaeon]
MKVEMDEKDRCILRELLSDGRLSYSELGRRCGLSRQTVFNRVRRLFERGLIRKFSACVDAERLGLPFKAYVLIVAKPDRALREELAEFLRRCRCVTQLHLLFGRFDFFVELLVRDKAELTAFIKSLHAFGAVERTETFMVYETLKHEPEAPLLAALDAGGGI